MGARKVVPQPVEKTEEEPAGRCEGNGDAVPEGHRQARPGREKVEDGGVGRPRGDQDLRLIERDLVRVEPAQDLAAFVGRAERPEDLDAAVLAAAGNVPGGEQPGQPARLRVRALAARRPTVAGSRQSEDRIAGDEDETVAGRGPDEVALEPAQTGVRRAEGPGRRERPRPGRPRGGREESRRVEKPFLFEGTLVAADEASDLLPFAFDEEAFRTEVGARQPGQPEVPDGAVEGVRQPRGRRPFRSPEIADLAGVVELPEEAVRQGELRRRGQRPSRSGFPATLQDLAGERPGGDEAEIDPGAGLAGQRFADLPPDHERGTDEDLVVEGMFAAEAGQEADGRVRRHLPSGIR